MEEWADLIQIGIFLFNTTTTPLHTPPQCNINLVLFGTTWFLNEIIQPSNCFYIENFISLELLGSNQTKWPKLRIFTQYA